MLSRAQGSLLAAFLMRQTRATSPPGPVQERCLLDGGCYQVVGGSCWWVGYDGVWATKAARRPASFRAT